VAALYGETYPQFGNCYRHVITVAVGGTTHMETLLVREESCAKRLRGVVHEGLLRDDATGEPSAR
jgi:hypothetical protein